MLKYLGHGVIVRRGESAHLLAVLVMVHALQLVALLNSLAKQLGGLDLHHLLANHVLSLSDGRDLVSEWVGRVEVLGRPREVGSLSVELLRHRWISLRTDRSI